MNPSLLHREIPQAIDKNGHGTAKYILDNEYSTHFRTSLHNKGIIFELVPPHHHRRNSAERAIRTFKNHIIVGLTTCDPAFPLREWDRLIDQGELTLKLLRNSRVNPLLSSWAYLFDNNDFKNIPLVSPGTKIILYSKPGQRKSWAFHRE